LVTFPFSRKEVENLCFFIFRVIIFFPVHAVRYSIRLIYIMASGQKWMKRACAISSSSGSGRYDKWREWWLYSGGRHWTRILWGTTPGVKIMPTLRRKSRCFHTRKVPYYLYISMKKKKWTSVFKMFQKNIYLFE